MAALAAFEMSEPGKVSERLMAKLISAFAPRQGLQKEKS
jgi:hypothetical protein